jgi:hypothetical protein
MAFQFRKHGVLEAFGFLKVEPIAELISEYAATERMREFILVKRRRLFEGLTCMCYGIQAIRSSLRSNLHIHVVLLAKYETALLNRDSWKRKSARRYLARMLDN